VRPFQILRDLSAQVMRASIRTGAEAEIYILTSITLLSIFLLIACGFRKLAGHGVECQAMAAEY
jgi:hypothetical protein